MTAYYRKSRFLLLVPVLGVDNFFVKIFWQDLEDTHFDCKLEQALKLICIFCVLMTFPIEHVKVTSVESGWSYFHCFDDLPYRPC